MLSYGSNPESLRSHLCTMKISHREYSTESEAWADPTLGTAALPVGFADKAVNPLLLLRSVWDSASTGDLAPPAGRMLPLTSRADLVPIKALQTIVGIETHLTPRFDFNFYAGDEYYGRGTFSTNTGLFGSTTPGTNIIGYGAPQFINNGCTENATGTPLLCMSATQNRNVWTAQPQMWYRLYRGNRGTLQLGASYAYTYRRTWDGLFTNSNSGNIPSFRPLAIENIVMTSFRYSLP